MTTEHVSPNPDRPRSGMVETVVLTVLFAFVALGACGLLLLVLVAIGLLRDGIENSYQGVVISNRPLHDLPSGHPLEAQIDGWAYSPGPDTKALSAWGRPTWLPEGATDVECAPDGVHCIYKVGVEGWTYARGDPPASVDLTALRNLRLQGVVLVGGPGRWTVLAERYDPWPQSILATMGRVLERRSEPISLAEHALVEVRPQSGATLRYLSQGHGLKVSPDRTRVAFRRSRAGKRDGPFSSAHVWSAATDRIDDVLTTESCDSSAGFGFDWSSDSRYLLLRECLSWSRQARPPAGNVETDLRGPVLFDTATGQLHQRSRRLAPTATPAVPPSSTPP